MVERERGENISSCLGEGKGSVASSKLVNQMYQYLIAIFIIIINNKEATEEGRGRKKEESERKKEKIDPFPSFVSEVLRMCIFYLESGKENKRRKTDCSIRFGLVWA
jgi:hypothetical protein